MRRNLRTRFTWIAIVMLGAAILNACNQSGSNESSAAASADSGKMPITTKSDEARKEFLQGRDLSDRLLAADSLQHFDKAIALDPNFASAELARANSSATAKDFLDHLNKAVGLADKTSDGEKLFILSNQDGANGDMAKQKADLDKLLAAYPHDERVEFNVGAFNFGQQDFPQAIEHLKKATELAPAYSASYNMLGYSYRQIGDYTNAEQAFKKYIELIPNDPNPYDSYAEMLLKMGRFEESVAQYRKALSLDPNFSASHFGIAADLTYMGKPADAEAELHTMADKAQDDGQLRTALFGLAVVDSDSGKFDQALKQMDKEYAVAEKKNDVASMSADLQAMGNILMEVPNYDKAKQQFDRSWQTMQDSTLSQGIKDNATLQHHYNLAVVAAGKKDYKTANSEAEEFRKGAEASNNPVQVRLSHELAGRIALSQKAYDPAIAELQQASQQNPRNLYRLCQAYSAKGDSDKAHEYCTQAAGFNSLPALNYAFIREKAQKMLAGKKS